jgi:hypothetical protein
LETQALVAKELGYLEEEHARPVEALTVETGRILNGLINSFRRTQVEVPIGKKQRAKT